jgi:ActR/RegA family two-component response regulator
MADQSKRPPPTTGLVEAIQAPANRSPLPETPSSTVGQALLLSKNSALQEMFQRTCAEQQWQAIICNSDESLLAARMKAPHPVVVGIDVEDSFQEAYATYGQLRQTAAFSKVPVLFLIQPPHVNEALESCNLTTNDYLVKPFTAQHIARKVERLSPKDQEQQAKGKFKVGELLGRRYEIVRFLGEGGMGQVYLVRDMKDGKEYAFKLLFNDNGDGNEAPNQAALRRFQKEIEALLALSHPNVIKIYHYGQHLDFSYYTMDYLPHGCIADRLEERGALPYQEALQLLVPIASALHHAHQNNILHRDLKPGNIMFKEGGAPIVTDFGLALQIENRQTRLTKKGHIIGTANYMAPEQVTAPQTLDARADVYALGALFFEMITGRPPFVGKDYVEILRQLLTQPAPDPRAHYAQIPEHIAMFTQLAMAKERDKRFPSAAALVTAAAKLLAIG